jgi:hypothetical protein
MKRMLRWMWVPVGLAVLYTGFTLLSRRQTNRAIDRAAVEERAESDRRIVDQLGGGELKILTLYANPPVLARGQKGLLCYGVASAESVEIEPAVEGVSPALSRCVEIRPDRDTTYTLTARGAGGAAQTRSIELRVR